jgi:hypothetical protein
MSTNDVSLVFASLSRFISLNNLDSAKFSQFKHEFTLKLAKDSDLDVSHVTTLAVALAAEDMRKPALWDKFANLVLSNEHKLRQELF